MGIFSIGSRGEIMCEWPSIVNGCVVRLVRDRGVFYSQRVVGGRVDDAFTFKITRPEIIDGYLREAAIHGTVHVDPRKKS